MSGLAYGDRAVCFGVTGTVVSKEPTRDGRVAFRVDGEEQARLTNVRALRKLPVPTGCQCASTFPHFGCTSS